MKSIDKLKRLTGENIATPQRKAADGTRSSDQSSDSRKAEIEELRRRIEAVVSRRQAVSKADRQQAAAEGNMRLGDILGGAEVENEHGRFLLVSNIVRSASPHGHRPIGEAFNFDMTAAAMLANNPGISEYTCSDALFLDTETTGLAGGTGTMAFLIGLGWFEDGHFHVRQIMARDFGEEKAALVHLDQIASRKKFLVTFNGKAFDINLLATRFIMNRVASALSTMPHLDLLHPSRRILGHRLENSRLVTLEAYILGVEREGDIPGWEIPQRYFDWLRKRDPQLLAAIFEHNRLDVVSMASLTAHLTEILTAQTTSQQVHADDYLAAARLLLNRSHREGVEKILNIFQVQSCSLISAPSKKKLAQLYKRTGRLDEAVQIWREMAARASVDFYAVSELAKWLEHRGRDYFRAKALIEQALRQDNTFSTEERESLLHRLKRLNTKSEQ
jgi:uncharacterized protein